MINFSQVKYHQFIRLFPELFCLKFHPVITLSGVLILWSGSVGWVGKAEAQIIPDASLNNPTLVTPDGTTYRITGGTEIGGNLFHSFQEFSLITGNTAQFENSVRVENILTRITGKSPSTIDGIIRANGSANLYLINPNGIVFGPNAELNIGGSFFASTAESIVLADGTLFSAINPESPPLLTVNVPVGLQFGPNPGTLVVQSQGIDKSGETGGLQGSPGQTLGLFGGNVLLEGGQVRSPGGQIHLGSVAGNSRISLIPTSRGIQAGYEAVESFQDIQLTQQSRLNTSGEGGGTIHLQGRQINISEGSQVLGINIGSQPGGSVKIKATELVALTGADPDNFTVMISDNQGVGTGGDLTIETGQFLLQGTAFLSASSFGSGAGGNLSINAVDSITLIGVGFGPLELVLGGALTGQLQPGDRIGGLFAGTVGLAPAGNITLEAGNAIGLYNGAIVFSPTFGTESSGKIQMRAHDRIEAIAGGIFSNTALGSAGSAGNIEIETGHLSIQDGSIISSSTLGSGPGGDITINASQSIEIARTLPENLLPTGILNNTIFGSGTGGDIQITTGQLSIREGALIVTSTGTGPNVGSLAAGGPGGNILIEAKDSIEILGVSPDGAVTSSIGTSTFGDPPSGDLTISTRQLTVTDGGIVSTGTFGSGRGGTLTVNATAGMDISGSSPITGLPTGLDSSSGRADFENQEISGPAGDLRINTGQLRVRDGANIDVRSLGPGNAGTLEIVAGSVRLDRGGSLNATTVSGAGGDIQLRSPDILLSNGSNITTNAGNTNGGNITIQTRVLTALGNSDITANALAGRGGRVSIDAEGIFGTDFRETPTASSDITATSELGPEFSGSVELNTPDTDSSLGIVPLQENFVDATQLIAQNFCAKGQESSFTITGRGGLPASPTENLNVSVILDDLRLVPTAGTRVQGQAGSEETLSWGKPSPKPPLVEAQGWRLNPGGTVVLVTEPFQVSPQSSWVRDGVDCRESGD
ncbi:filamentous hemagglutinin N-terminal domain-containing protein [Oscillatoria acuminata]|uniref:Filamentous hemagglutinin family N-terminal domain protein n=1 Tax=Oscillatoria acuminata PCC 6304 TaxID=56110 RepID=K9TFT0_9CYAN|nr:S-layer family protein [Oscillatoria acuminata]AFY80864.1 filamentous hemagglutinin family N-terminal domain protein [Oscillatoria acuminata PCC 6304]